MRGGRLLYNKVSFCVHRAPDGGLICFQEGTMTMRKAFVSAASVLAVLMAVSLTFLIPSGAVTEEAQQRYLDAA